MGVYGYTKILLYLRKNYIHMKPFYLFILFSMLLPGSTLATHLMGGEITALDLGSNFYRIELVLYRDVTGKPMEDSVKIYFEGPNNTNFNTTVGYHKSIDGNLDPMYPQGTEVYFYVDTVNLLAIGSWNIYWSLCCRNGAIQNLGWAADKSMYLNTVFKTYSNSSNSSPQFLVPAAVHAPLDTFWLYNSLPYDPDGDSLFWHLDAPMDSIGSHINGYTSPPSDPSLPLTLDPLTGTLYWWPNTIGNFVTTILVEEYRAGVLIGSIRRDVQFIVRPNVTGSFNLKVDTTLQVDGLGYFYKDIYKNDTCSIELVLGHDDPTKVVWVGAYSEIFTLNTDYTSLNLSYVNGTNTIKAIFKWVPSNTSIREEPYKIVFRSSDWQFTQDFTILLYAKGALANEEFKIARTKVYPNPARTTINLELNKNQNIEITNIEVINLQGKSIKQVDVLNESLSNQISINIEALQSGPYFLKILFDNGKIDYRKILIGN